MKIDQTVWTIANVRQEMDFYLASKPELKELMDLYAAILAIEAEYLPLIDTKMEIEETAEIERKIAEGANLLNPTKIVIEPEQFKEVLTKMAAIVAAQNPALKPGLDRLISYPDLDVDTKGVPPVFIDALLKFNTQYFTKIAELIELDTDIMFFLTYHAMNPFIESVARQYRGLYDDAAWGKTTCPVCGRKPSQMYKRRDDGETALQCQICRTEWTYPADTCVICGNADPETYKFLYDEADPAHAVHVCDGCKKYIKSTDAQALDRDIDVEVEDLATLVLDYVAKEQGYEPGGRVTFAVSLDYPEDAPETDGDEEELVEFTQE